MGDGGDKTPSSPPIRRCFLVLCQSRVRRQLPLRCLPHASYRVFNACVRSDRLPRYDLIEQSYACMHRNGPNLFKRSVRGRLVVLALVAVAARGLIPVGFMPGLVDGHPQLVICNGHMAGMVHLGHHDHSGANADVLCPYAHGGGAAPLYSDPALASAYATVIIVVPLIERTVPVEAPPRFTAPRGPPSVV